MKDLSTLPAGVIIDSRGFFAFPGHPMVATKFAPQIKFFNILEGAQYQPDGSLEQYQVAENCRSAQIAARWPTPTVPGFTVGAVANFDGSGFHFAGNWPGEKQNHFADVETINPDVAATIETFLAWADKLPVYVPPGNVDPHTWGQS